LRDSLSGFSRKNEKERSSGNKRQYAFGLDAAEKLSGIIRKSGLRVKLTLLKILSQITPPTLGKITARGELLHPIGSWHRISCGTPEGKAYLHERFHSRNEKEG